MIMETPLERYRRAFDAARQRARKLGLAVPAFTLSNELYLEDLDRLRGAGPVIAKYLHTNGLEISDLAIQCWRANMEIKYLLQAHFDAPLVLTFGAIETSPGVIRFQMSENELTTLVREGLDLSNPKLNLHAWLTFPSLEILDITYFTSFAVVNEMPQLLGMVVSGQHGTLNPQNYAYHPLIIGEDFVTKAGLNRVAIRFN
jgi:hypothetical protein